LSPLIAFFRMTDMWSILKIKENMKVIHREWEIA
jgi:hypothetical protein